MQRYVDTLLRKPMIVLRAECYIEGNTTMWSFGNDERGERGVTMLTPSRIKRIYTNNFIPVRIHLLSQDERQVIRRSNIIKYVITDAGVTPLLVNRMVDINFEFHMGNKIKIITEPGQAHANEETLISLLIELDTLSIKGCIQLLYNMSIYGPESQDSGTVDFSEYATTDYSITG